MSRSPREVAEQVRRMVAGEGVEFADLFAEDGVLTYPFGLPGQPAELHGREAIRGYFRDLSRSRDLLVMEGVEALVRETEERRSGDDGRIGEKSRRRAEHAAAHHLQDGVVPYRHPGPAEQAD